MTKANLISSINGYLTSIVTIAKHRLSMLDLTNTVYPTIIPESYTNIAETNTNTTPIGTAHYYTTYWIKQGRLVSVFGNITNKTGATTTNESYITIDTGEFTPQLIVNTFFANSLSDNRAVKCEISGNVIRVIGAISNNESISFQFNYFSKD